MANTLLEAVKSNESLYALLQKDPTSKLLRSYIKEQFNLNSLPVLVTIEEWEEWLGAQSIPMKSGSTSVTQPSSVLSEYLELASTETVEAYQDCNYYVRGVASVTEECCMYFRTLLKALDSNDLMTVLSPILKCETEKELNSLSFDDIVSDLEFYALEQLEDFIRRSVSYDPGDINVKDQESEVGDLEVKGLSEELEKFVKAAIEHRRRQILNG